MENTDVKIIDTTYYSIGFPEEDWNIIINRDNYLTQIAEDLADYQIVFLEGEEDVGKSTICAQFSRRYVDKCISVFFNPFNLLDFRQEFLFSNVVEQIMHLLGEEDYTESIYIGNEKYHQYLFQLRKKTKNSKSKIYLVIDGLESMIQENPEFVKEIIDILPLGYDFFKLVISGNKRDYFKLTNRIKDEESQSITIAGFSNIEIREYLQLNEINDLKIQELFNISRGFPGRLKTFRRLLKSQSIDNLLNNPSNYKRWIEIDCDIDLDNIRVNQTIALLALSENTFQTDELCQIINIDEKSLIDCIDTVHILKNSNGSIQFVSQAHKKYFSNLKRGQKREIDELLIKFHASSEKISSKIELAKIYDQNKNWGNILDLIDEQLLESILEKTGVLKKANESLDIGINASLHTNAYAKMWKYSIQGSIINELDNFLFWESEIEARVSLRDYIGAISLANSAILKVDRFALLALIARRQKEINGHLDEDLALLISDLYKVTDLIGVGDKIYDIVSDLIYAIPNVAIEIIEKSSGNIADKNINDWIIAKLSIAAINSNSRDSEIDDSEKSKKLEALKNLNNPSVQKINRAIAFLVGNYSAPKVLDEVRKLSDSVEKLRLLRLWLNNNPSNIQDLDQVIETALEELVKATSKSLITIDTLTELTFQLPFIKDNDRKKDLLKKLKLIEKEVQDWGLCKNKYIYKLNIFHTIYTINPEDSNKILEKIINDIESISDTLIKLESYSEVYVKLKSLKEGKKSYEQKIKFLYSRILLLSDELFKDTANHFHISQNIIRTVSKVSPLLSLKICVSINTQHRRDQARTSLLDSYLNNNTRFIKIENIEKIYASFECMVVKELIINRILYRYSQCKTLHYSVIQDLFKFIQIVDSVADPYSKLNGYVLSYKIIHKNETWKNRLSKNFEDKIENCLAKLSADWERIDTGFKICSELSNINIDFASKIFHQTDKLKNDSWLDSKEIAYTFLNSIKIVLRSFSGLLITKTWSQDDYRKIETLINRVPSEAERLNLWTELAINATVFACDDLTRKVHDNHIIPLIEGLKNNSCYLRSVFLAILPIHFYNPTLAIEYIKLLKPKHRERIIAIICDYYILKKNPFEVYDLSEPSKPNFTYSDFDKVINLIELSDVDSNIYGRINDICKALMINKSPINKIQSNLIIDKLKAISSSKLPDSKNITHEGYLILCELDFAIVLKDFSFCNLLIERTNLIPNLSDRIFVKAHLLKEIPFEKIQNGSDIRKNLFDEILDGLASIRIHYERIQRVIDLTDIMYKIDRENWKKTITNAFSISKSLEDGSEAYYAQKNIIDSIYRIDQEYAKELMKTIDKDTQSHSINNLLHNHFEMLEISKKIKNNQTIDEKEKQNYRRLVNGIFMALKALNSNKISPKKISEISNYLAISNKLPLHEAFPIYMYFLANCCKMYRERTLDGPVSEIHKGNFKEALISTSLVEFLSNHRKFIDRNHNKFFVDEEFLTNKSIHAKSRDEAFSFIREWMVDEVEEFVYIVDPYFSKEDLEILKMVRELNQNIDIEILGCKDGIDKNIELKYKEHWKQICDEDPLFTSITFCWLQDNPNQYPLHDRWILTKNGGLRMGTSINSLGNNKESELSIMKPSESLVILEDTIDEYIRRKKRVFNNQRLCYKSFSL